MLTLIQALTLTKPNTSKGAMHQNIIFAENLNRWIFPTPFVRYQQLRAMAP